MPLAVGDIVYLYVPSLLNPKDKFAVVACLQPKPLLLLISTEVTAFRRSRPELSSAQIVVDVASHPCLKYDSWLDCTEPHGYEGLAEECDKDPDIIVGHISTDLQDKIIEVVKSSRTLPKRDIKRILAAFGIEPAG